MKLKVEKGIFERFPDLNIGVVVARGIDNGGSDEETLGRIRERAGEIRAGMSRETLSANPKIDAWRKAYSSFGAKPKKYRSSVENLYRMILEGAELRHINKIVDIYNYISLKHSLPVGGDDIDKIEGDITLKFAKGDEPFVELNSGETKNPREGEVVYADNEGILCRRWNWRECDKSKMTQETKNAVLVVEGLPPATRGEVEEAIRELGGLVQKSCGGEIRTAMVDSSSPEAEI